MSAESGHRVPFTEFVLKLNSECNLACSYCYMYASVDAVARGPAKVMSTATVTQVGRRIAEHSLAHGTSAIRIVLHGGEPLLCGIDSVAETVSELRTQIGPTARPDFSLQTNGLLLTEAAIRILRDINVRVGVSLDGGRTTNDRYRLFRDGRSSYDSVVQAVALLRQYPEIFAGILSVVDVESDPTETYQSLLALSPPMIDFLLPHGNWTHPPVHRPPDGSSPYGEWLVTVFNRWYDAPRKEVGVRLFEEIIVGLLGGSSRTESVGLSPVGLIVVDTAGALEQVDALRTTAPGVRSTGLNVFDDSFDAALSHADVLARQRGIRALSDICVECLSVHVCGGGYYPHRYRTDTGFRNPSVYCTDLKQLIEHIGGRVRADVIRIREKISK